MPTLEEYRKQRDKRTQKLFEKAEESAKGPQSTRPVDERFWEPSVGKDGNGYAVIRLLDSRPGEDFPFARVWYHYFQGPTGKWYIENSRTTLGETDPCGELNSQLWNTELEENQNIVRKQKRKTKYISNILVVKDPDHPENEGKVFLYGYGKTIFDKINTLMNPSNEYDEPQNPFDLETGRNLRIRIKSIKTGERAFKNYDDSDWDAPSPIAKSPKAIEDIWSQCYSLTEFTDPKNFKSFDELKKRLNEVIGGDGGTVFAPAAKTNGGSKPAPVKTAETTITDSVDDADIDEDDLLERLAGLTKD